ncbi:GTP pyrophosphokinase (p)ppGpp synthetase II [Liberibacter crescens BT-1]|uniref:GTP pyrophosphokinase rsh n=1 Tax=Liberibacter crescens (strain BT-1) TaxID=1215343 RepID=L0EV15_LIBCB|nr:bifunctional (p)ppGpp synthetase/guanosine-3',5'-bis(diphosphate) 3'-pyrophosphohydrolase [Liberibacter crescens]AGA64685.1 GTP pyrophosphokinase (p)ppGpp synthetase II [Liberibacter crescens BT-1]AMC12784.1 GTP pyrophosphokinase [Liberibacter crescens]
MIRQYELVERIQSYNPNVNESLLNKAYVYAMQKHSQQKRASGDPYISHPIEVAAILADMRLDESTIVVALLHDILEDTTATRAEIDELFGPEVGHLVEDLTKIKKIEIVSFKTKQAENLRKLLLAICDDVRVLLVKLADRLHNMRTLDYMPLDKRIVISKETMDIYAPLAGRMGMQDMREELEELAFSYINPEAYKTIKDRLEELSRRNGSLVLKIEEELKELLEENKILNAWVKGRQKRAYSIFCKMQSKSLSFEQLSDVYGFRIVVEDIPSCYQVLGIIHTRWRIVPGYFKDYISTMKQNGYRSLHTTIIGPSYQRIELQIRTIAMDEVAEYGVAAHTLYKDRRTKDDIEVLLSETSVYLWLRQTIKSLAEGNSSQEFLEHAKLELFQEQVFCFTPKGKLIALPRNATPIDFAYAVHTNIGNSCVGAKINGRIMPLFTLLNNGDEVEIIRSSCQVPPSAWEEVVVTGKARSAIRRATRLEVRKQYYNIGQRILEKTFNKAGKEFSDTQLESVVSHLGQKEVKDLIASVGRGEVSPGEILSILWPEFKEYKTHTEDDKRKKIVKTTLLMKGKNLKNDIGALPIRGLPANIQVIFSQTGALPGDRIVALMRGKKSMAIYPIQSPALQKFEDKPERWVDVRWDLEATEIYRFISHIRINAVNTPGALKIITTCIADLNINIHNIHTPRTAEDFTEIRLDVEVLDVQHLSDLIKCLNDLECVATACRVFE